MDRLLYIKRLRRNVVISLKKADKGQQQSNPSEKVHETEVILENRKYYYLRSVKTTKLNEYSRKRKRPPKMQRLSGRLQEVVVYKK